MPSFSKISHKCSRLTLSHVPLTFKKPNQPGLLPTISAILIHFIEVTELDPTVFPLNKATFSFLSAPRYLPLKLPVFFFNKPNK